MGWKERLKHWRERLNEGDYDKNRGPWDYTDSFGKIDDPAQLRRKFVSHVVTFLLMVGGCVLFFAYYTYWAPSPPCSFNLGLIPGVVMGIIVFWNLCHAYKLRKKELADGEVGGSNNLSKLRRRFAPGLGLLLSILVLMVVMAVWHFPGLDSVTPEMVIFPAVMFCVLSICFWHGWCWYTRLKRETVDGEGPADRLLKTRRNKP